MSAQAAQPPVKITYATMSGDQLEELHGALDAAIPAVQAAFGQTHPMWINGHAVKTVDHFTDTSPIDTRIVLGQFAKGSALHVRDAINAARAAFPAWSRTSWQERVKLLRRVADVNRVIKQYFPLDNLVFVLVGKASEIEPLAKKYAPVVDRKSISAAGF